MVSSIALSSGEVRADPTPVPAEVADLFEEATQLQRASKAAESLERLGAAVAAWVGVTAVDAAGAGVACPVELQAEMTSSALAPYTSERDQRPWVFTMFPPPTTWARRLRARKAARSYTHSLRQ